MKLHQNFFLFSRPQMQELIGFFSYSMETDRAGGQTKASFWLHLWRVWVGGSRVAHWWYACIGVLRSAGPMPSGDNLFCSAWWIVSRLGLVWQIIGRRQIDFYKSGIPWPIFWYFHHNLQSLINYLCIFDITLRKLSLWKFYGVVMHLCRLFEEWFVAQQYVYLH